MKYMGKTVTVTGKIINAVDYQSIVVLGMGKNSQEEGSFGIEIYVEKSKLPADLYVGKTISVTGTVKTNPVGGPSMEVKELSQIVIK